MRTALLSTAAAVALALGTAPVLAQTQAPSSSGTAPGQIKPPATSSETPGKAESAPGQNRPGALTDAPGKPEAAPGRSQSSPAPSNSSTERTQSRQGSSSQDTSSAGSNVSSSDQSQRPAASGSESPNQASNGQQRPQQGSSPSTSASTTSNTTTNAVANLNTDQRSEVTRSFSSANVNTVSNVNFDVSVGTTITEEVRLAPLPAEVVRIVPQYRGYQYVVVRDEIVIVEPRTKKIVEVIHKSGTSRKSASVSLSSEQRKKFKTTVETTGSTRPSPSAKIEIREGVTLPQEVEIMEVPETIITEVPELRTYRYVVIGDEVALVEPETRRVIEVIE